MDFVGVSAHDGDMTRRTASGTGESPCILSESRSGRRLTWPLRARQIVAYAADVLQDCCAAHLAGCSFGHVRALGFPAAHVTVADPVQRIVGIRCELVRAPVARRITVRGDLRGSISAEDETLPRRTSKDTSRLLWSRRRARARRAPR